MKRLYIVTMSNGDQYGVPAEVIADNYAKYYEIPVIIVATKEDKLKRNDLQKNEKLIKQTLDFDPHDQFIRFSSLNKVGIDQVWNEILKLCGIEEM